MATPPPILQAPGFGLDRLSVQFRAGRSSLSAVMFGRLDEAWQSLRVDLDEGSMAPRVSAGSGSSLAIAPSGFEVTVLPGLADLWSRVLALSEAELCRGRIPDSPWRVDYAVITTWLIELGLYAMPGQALPHLIVQLLPDQDQPIVLLGGAKCQAGDLRALASESGPRRAGGYYPLPERLNHEGTLRQLADDLDRLSARLLPALSDLRYDVPVPWLM